MKKLIIVADPKTEQYANFFRGLLSQKSESEDIDVSIHTEKQYLQEKPKLSSNQKTLFIGNSQAIKKERTNFDTKYNEYGMVFGSLGKQACLYVDHTVSVKEYASFIETANKIQANVKEVLSAKDIVAPIAGAAIVSGSVIPSIASTLVFTPFAPVIGIAGPAFAASRFIKYKREVTKQQYDCLVLKCYKDFIYPFME